MEKQQVFYIHGGCAFSEYKDYLTHLRNMELDSFAETHRRWNKTLAEDLGDEFETFMSTFPNKYNAKYEEWVIWFEKHFPLFRDGLILVGWSQGSMFLQKYLASNDMPVSVKGLFLLSSPHGYFKDEESGEDGGDFNFVDTDNVASIATKVPKIILIHSKDDPVVPYEHTLKLHELLSGAELVTFEDKNHLFVDELPELVERIKGLN
jgi:predicted alpha/beta hydrolase family esterase